MPRPLQTPGLAIPPQHHVGTTGANARGDRLIERNGSALAGDSVYLGPRARRQHEPLAGAPRCPEPVEQWRQCIGPDAGAFAKTDGSCLGRDRAQRQSVPAIVWHAMRRGDAAFVAVARNGPLDAGCDYRIRLAVGFDPMLACEQPCACPHTLSRVLLRTATVGRPCLTGLTFLQ